MRVEMPVGRSNGYPRIIIASWSADLLPLAGQQGPSGASEERGRWVSALGGKRT